SSCPACIFASPKTSEKPHKNLGVFPGLLTGCALTLLTWNGSAGKRHARRRIETMPRDAGQQAPLSVHYAFVVHLRVNAEVTQGRVAGRVEHVASGQSAHFASLDELLAFMGRVLATVRAPPCGRRPR